MDGSVRDLWRDQGRAGFHGERPSNTENSGAQKVAKWGRDVFIKVKRFGDDVNDVSKDRSAVAFPANIALGGKAYDLHGVIEHQGRRSDRGHFIAFVRRTDREWYKCNDQTVTATTWESVRGREAYVLHYRCDE